MDDLIGTPLHIDAFELLAQLPDGCVDLCFCDPPYNIGVFSKMPPDEYLAWCERWIAEASRVLAANGALWVVHSVPDVLCDISKIIERYGRGRVNFIAWDKWNGGLDNTRLRSETWGAYWKMVNNPGIRCFPQAAEYLVYHTDEGDWTAQCDRERGFIFEPLRAYLADEWRRAGFTFEQANEACGTASMAGRHFFSRSQWCLPTKEHYYSLREYANNHNHGGEYLRREYEDLRREYEDLRREYEDLRYTFNNPGKVSSVWQIPPAPRNGHPTPKPEALLARIIETTSNAGDLVLDFFAGSFTSAVVAQRLGRRWICGDYNAGYVALGERRLSEARQMELTL